MATPTDTRINRLFLLLVLVGPLHMIEQMLTSIEEFYWLRSELAGLYTFFAPLPADVVSVMLITIVWTKVSLLLYGLLVGGTPRLLVLALFGAFAASEAHHVVAALVKIGYDPGVLTSVPYSTLGCLLLVEVWRERRLGTTAALARERLA
jgi:hypothetical protein